MKNFPRMNGKPAALKGFTLIELLITLIIGVFITLAATSFLQQTARSYHNQDKTARVQENARYAVQMMSYDLRQAGYFGCSREAPYEDFAPVEGVDNHAGAASDTLTIRYANSTLGVYDIGTEDADKASPLPQGTTNIKIFNAGTSNPVPSESLFTQGQTILISDCTKSSVATVDSVNGTIVTLEEGLDIGFTTVAQIRLMSEYTYSIDDTIPNAPPTLVRTQDADEEPLVEGVDYMRVLYGVDFASDEDDAPNVYVGNPESVDGDVVSIKVGLLIRSISNKSRSDTNVGEYDAVDERNYTILDQVDFEPEEARVARRVFVNTLKLRN